MCVLNIFPTCAGALFERLAFEMAPRFQKQVFQKQVSFVVTLLYIPHIPRRPASIKDFPQRGRAAKRPTPFVGGGRRPPPLCRLAFGGYVGYRAMSRQKDLLLKDLLLKCRGHLKSKSFKNRSSQVRDEDKHAQACLPSPALRQYSAS